MNTRLGDPAPAHPACSASDSRLRLLDAIEQHVELLLGTISLYARRMGLDGGTDGRGLAVDILQETVVEALTHAERFTATGQPVAWLLGIAVNVIRRKQVEQAKHARRELSLSRLTAHQSTPLSEQDLLDRLTPTEASAADLGSVLESDEAVAALLALVSSADQQVLRLGVLEDLERETLAQRLGVSVGTANMRLHRALGRLRSAWAHHQNAGEKEAPHE